jgi:hypothetical protein
MWVESTRIQAEKSNKQLIQSSLLIDSTTSHSITAVFKAVINISAMVAWDTRLRVAPREIVEHQERPGERVKPIRAPHVAQACVVKAWVTLLVFDAAGATDTMTSNNAKRRQTMPNEDIRRLMF